MNAPPPDDASDHKPITWTTLDGWLDAALARVMWRAMLAVIGALMAGAYGYAVLQMHDIKLDADIARIDVDGSHALRGLRAGLDSLRLEVRYLPDRFAARMSQSSLERGGRTP